MTKQTEALKLALEALEAERVNYQDWDKEDGAPEYIHEAITALQEALAEDSSGVEQPDMNLSCKSVQARLAANWGYVKAEQPAQPQQETEHMVSEGRAIKLVMAVANDMRIEAMKAQPQQEPVKVGRITDNIKGMVLRQEVMLYTDDYLPIGTALYTSPPAQRKPKTEEFIKHAWANSAPNIGFGDFLVLFRAIEAAHGIKGGA